MTSPPAVKKARPLSPHLQIYKLPLAANLSISHRITGVALSFGMMVFTAWLVCLAEGEETYTQFLNYTHTLLGQIVLFGFTFAFFFHFCMGIRHLVWDTGHALDLPNVKRGSVIAVTAAVLLTLGMWAGFMWCHQ